MKTCYCRTCGQAYHYLGITRHRAMHRDKKETCEIRYTHGNVEVHPYGERKKNGNPRKV